MPMPNAVEMMEVMTPKHKILGVFAAGENRSGASVSDSIMPPIRISMMPMSRIIRVFFKIFPPFK